MDWSDRRLRWLSKVEELDGLVRWTTQMVE